jgi:hypothetical protein
MTAAYTTTCGGLTYGYSVEGDLLWVITGGDPDPIAVATGKPPPDVPPECWRTAEFDSAQAWSATLAVCKGQR